jgi:endogenous inhibitor of DNA gyrase (YacG/DUF329 family)
MTAIAARPVQVITIESNVNCPRCGRRMRTYRTEQLGNATRRTRRCPRCTETISKKSATGSA